MDTREIPRSEWPTFLEQFSRVHRGQSAHVHTTMPQALNRTEEPNLPLLGVVDERGPAGDRRDNIRITLGAPAGGGVVTHEVHDPSRLRFAEWNDGYSAELNIENTRGEPTVVHVGPQEQLLPPGVITDGVMV
jgi:hypothetical protein